jgi:hypothetical protein
MPLSRRSEVEEPMGIVISRGTRAEPTPRLVAYVWGPAPVLDEPAEDSKAA